MNIGTSIRRLMNLFIILFVTLGGGLVYWQVVVAQQVAANVHNSRSCQLENSPLRGTIYDRNGQWLAKSVSDSNAQCGYRRVYFDPSLAGLIGYYAGPNYPATGIEKQFDDVLSGRTGLTMLNNTFNQLLHSAPSLFLLFRLLPECDHLCGGRQRRDRPLLRGGQGADGVGLRKNRIQGCRIRLP